uniref:DNA polymerase eta n=1 Tax=Cyprinus carpio TaxID=7962 RepID=A0A8C2DBJ1_CYPCA
MDIEKERVIALVDMDLEQRINPELKNNQYKTWKGGGGDIYEARAHGVSRNMWADDARKLCPDLVRECAILHPIMLFSPNAGRPK